MAYTVQTSEDVEKHIKIGSFGLAQETAEILNEAIHSGEEKGLCLGEALGEMLSVSDFPYKHISLLAAAYD